MNLNDIGKKIKLNLIDLYYNDKKIPTDSFGEVLGYECNFKILWKVENDYITSFFSKESIDAMEKGGIISYLSENTPVPAEPLFKKGDIVKEKDSDNFYLITKEVNYNVIESCYEYDVESIVAKLKQLSFVSCFTFVENELEEIKKGSMIFDYDSNKYLITLEKVMKKKED